MKTTNAPRWIRKMPEEAHPDEKPYYIVELGHGIYGEVDEQPSGWHKVYVCNDAAAEESKLLAEFSPEVAIDEVLHLALVMLSGYFETWGARFGEMAENVLDAQGYDPIDDEAD